jgi:hypothetical protein
MTITKNETSKPELYTVPSPQRNMEHGTLQIAFCFLGFLKPKFRRCRYRCGALPYRTGIVPVRSSTGWIGRYGTVRSGLVIEALMRDYSNVIRH